MPPKSTSNLVPIRNKTSMLTNSPLPILDIVAGDNLQALAKSFYSYFYLSKFSIIHYNSLSYTHSLIISLRSYFTNIITFLSLF